uniref:Uncharacterized protein n=2 Tax=Cyprinus carpio TaxID=7962 RepID=A0A8C1LIZ3_CYPCA
SHDPFNVVQTTTLTNKTFILLYFILPCKQGYDFKFIRRSRLFKECLLVTYSNVNTEYCSTACYGVLNEVFSYISHNSLQSPTL